MKKFYLVNAGNPETPNVAPLIYVAQTAQEIIDFVDKHPELVVNVKVVSSIS